MDYNRWINQIFNRKVKNEFELAWSAGWYWEMDKLSGLEKVRLLVETFQNTERDLSRFSKQQVALGLNLLTGEAEDTLCCIYDVDVPAADRLEVVNSIFSLFRDCIAKRCRDVFVEDLSDPLANYGYMFWDASQIHVGGFHQNPADPAKQALIDATFGVLEKTLAIPHTVCQQAALHGLGHTLMGGEVICREPFETAYSKRVETIIDDFLATDTIPDERLRKYALQARTGRVN